MNDLPPSDYLRLAEATLAALEAAADTADLDSKREGGVLTLELDNGLQIIVNLQPAIQELWLASRMGAYHFRHDGAGWRDTREARAFDTVVREALEGLGGPRLDLSALA